MNWRRIFLWVLIAACLVLLQQLLSAHAERLLFSGDSVLFWAAGRLILAGRNPYDEHLIQEVLAAAGYPTQFNAGIAMPRMFYPPWTLPLLMPFGLLSYPIFRLAWPVTLLAVLAVMAHSTWKMAAGPARLLWLPLLLALTFAPAARVISIGNLAPLMLLGVIPCIRLLRRADRRWQTDLLAGMLAVLVTIKPQLLYLYLAALGLWALHQRRWAFILGVGVGVAVATALALAFNPQVIGQYLGVLQRSPVAEWATPTLGAVLRLVFGTDRFWLQYVPPLLGLAWLAWYWWQRRASWDWRGEMPLLLTVSLATTAYAWTYDMVFWVIPLVMAVAGLLRGERRKLWLFLGLYAVIDLAVFWLYTRVNDIWLFWLAPVLLVWTVLAQRQAVKKIPAETAVGNR